MNIEVEEVEVGPGSRKRQIVLTRQLWNVITVIIWGTISMNVPTGRRELTMPKSNDEDEMLLMTHVDLKQNKKEGTRFLDSRCSNHMSGNKEWFTHLDEGFKHYVKLGNDSKLMVMGKGNIKLEF